MSADRKNCDIFQSNYRDLRSKKKKKKNRAKNPALTEEMRTGLNMFTLQLQLFFIKSKKF